MQDEDSQREVEASGIPAPGLRPDSAAPGSDPPRIGVFLFDCFEESVLAALLRRIPDPVAKSVETIVVMLDRPGRRFGPDLVTLARDRGLALQFHHPPRALEYGAVRKAAFEYGLRIGLERIVVMHGDGRHPAEQLGALLDEAVQHPRGLVVASRLSGALAARRPGMPFSQAVGLRLAHWLQNSILNLQVDDYQSSYRVYGVSALRRIPWQVNSESRCFDDEVLVQFRALDAPIIGVPMETSWSEHGGSIAALSYAVGALRIPLGYRLHQLHIAKHHEFIVNRDIHYTLKVSPTGSHMQIINAIASGTRVLDLGCSQGLLAQPLRERNVLVTGVDIHPPESVADELENYYQRDLEQELDLPEERDFDYVVIADVIEHIQNRQSLLQSARRYLKPSGRLIISTPNIAIWFYRLSLLIGRFEYGPRGVLDQTHVHLYTRATFQREVEAAGFQIVTRRVTALPFEIVFEATGKSRLMQALVDFYYALARAWPSMFAYQNILEAEILTLDEESTSSD